MQRPSRKGSSTTTLVVGAVVFVNALVLYSNVRSLYAYDDGDGTPSARDDGGEKGPPPARFSRANAFAAPPRVDKAAGGGRPLAPPAAANGEFAAARQRGLQGKQRRALPTLASLVTSEEEFRLVRRLVGSVHHWHLGAAIRLYVAFDISAELLSEARAWQDAGVVLPGALLGDLGLGLPPATPPPGGDWRPWRLAAVLHAAENSAAGAAVYVEPWAVVTGWLDHLFKELLRDGAIHVCGRGPEDPGARGYTAGISRKAPGALAELRQQAACLMQRQQQQQEEQQQEEEGGGGEAAQPEPCPHMKPPGDEVRCHPPESVLIELSSQPRQGGASMSGGAYDADPDSLEAEGLASSGGPGWEGAGEDGSRRDRELAKYACLVRLRHLGTGLSAELRAGASADDAVAVAAAPRLQRHLALGVPCLGSGGPLSARGAGLQQHGAVPPVLGTLLPSLLATARQQEGRTRYSLLVGFEAGDAAFDDPAQLQELQRSAAQQLAGAAGLPVSIKMYRLPASGSSAAMWNALFDLAAEAGADYFMAASEGTELPVPGPPGGFQRQQQLWSDAVIQALVENPIRKDFGVASPMARGRPNSLTHPTVHVATHREVFGAMFPDALVLGGGAQGHEKWASRVYGAHNTFLLTNVAVNPPGPTGRALGGGSSERPCGADAAQRAVDFAVEDSTARMHEWLQANGGREEAY